MVLIKACENQTVREFMHRFMGKHCWAASVTVRDCRQEYRVAWIDESRSHQFLEQSLRHGQFMQLLGACVLRGQKQVC